MLKLVMSIFLIIISSVEVFSQVKIGEFPDLSRPYLGQEPPGLTPAIFAPGVICTGLTERDIAITQDGKEVYFGINYVGNVTIMFTKFINGKWTEPEVAQFAKDQQFAHFEPCLSPDGKHIFFLTNRPQKGKEPRPGWFFQNIWAADRMPDGSWGEVYDPGPEINNSSYQYFPSMTSNGIFYFTRLIKQGEKPAIYRTRYISGKFSEPERLPEIINKSGELYNACIAPDESYLIACVDKRKSDINPGRGNYLVFFRDKNDSWSDGIELGLEINIPGSNAMSPYISPDGKYFFFAAQKKNKTLFNPSAGMTLKKVLEAYNSPQNGNYDIYWVDAKIIEKLRPKEIK